MDTKKRIYGLIGYPIKHSFSPAMHNAAFRYLKEQKTINYDAEYKLFEVKPEELEDFLLKDILINDVSGNPVYTSEIVGFNVTIPHKVRAKEILEKNKFPPPVDKELLCGVKISGAINTIRRLGIDKLEYWNTDIWGFGQSLRNDLKFVTKDKNILLVGCGGVGRAIIAAIAWNIGPKKIYINDISNEILNSAKEYFTRLYNTGFSFLEEKLEFITTENIPNVIKRCDLLVNTSPVGMKEGDSSILDKKLLHKGLSVYDVVYNRKTQLVKDAEELGLPATGGLNMLLYQGMLAFEIWTGKPAPEDVMRKALMEELEKR